LDGERELADQVARTQADDAAAEDAVAVGIEDELGEALVARVGDRTAGCGPWKFGDADLGAGLLCLVLREAYPGNLRVGVGDRGNDARIEIRALPSRRFGGVMR